MLFKFIDVERKAFFFVLFFDILRIYNMLGLVPVGLDAVLVLVPLAAVNSVPAVPSGSVLAPLRHVPRLNVVVDRKGLGERHVEPREVVRGGHFARAVHPGLAVEVHGKRGVLRCNRRGEGVREMVRIGGKEN